MLGDTYKKSVQEVNKKARKLTTLEQKITYGGVIRASRRRKVNRRSGEESGSKVSADGQGQLSQG